MERCVWGGRDPRSVDRRRQHAPRRRTGPGHGHDRHVQVAGFQAAQDIDERVNAGLKGPSVVLGSGHSHMATELTGRAGPSALGWANRGRGQLRKNGTLGMPAVRLARNVRLSLDRFAQFASISIGPDAYAIERCSILQSTARCGLLSGLQPSHSHPCDGRAAEDRPTRPIQVDG